MNFDIPLQTFSVEQFCKAHNLSRAKFYQLIKEGLAPKLMKVGKRTLISQESAKEWRLRMEVNQ